MTLRNFLLRDPAEFELDVGRRRRERDEDAAALLAVGLSPAAVAAVLATFHPEREVPPAPGTPRARALYGPLP